MKTRSPEIPRGFSCNMTILL